MKLRVLGDTARTLWVAHASYSYSCHFCSVQMHVYNAQFRQVSQVRALGLARTAQYSRVVDGPPGQKIDIENDVKKNSTTIVVDDNKIGDIEEKLCDLESVRCTEDFKSAER